MASVIRTTVVLSVNSRRNGDTLATLQPSDDNPGFVTLTLPQGNDLDPDDLHALKDLLLEYIDKRCRPE